MKKKLVLSILTTIIISLSSYSQRTRAESIMNSMESLTTLDLRERPLTGSPYVNEIFELAKFDNHDELYLMRYNAYQDQMEIKIQDSIYGLPKDINYSVTFSNTNKTYKTFRYHLNNKYNSGFFNVLYEKDNNFLLFKEKIKAFEEVKPKSGYQDYKPPTLKKVRGTIFIGYKNNTAQELPKKKKDILKLFASSTKDVGAYAKKNKLSLKDKDDLIKIFEYYYSN